MPKRICAQGSCGRQAAALLATLAAIVLLLPAAYRVAMADDEEPTVEATDGTAANASSGEPEKLEESEKSAAEGEFDESAADGAETVGHPLAQGMLQLMKAEIEQGFQRRNIEDRFARFRKYARDTLDTHAAPHTGSELTGNCRLTWYDHLMRNPLSSAQEAEIFTRELHQDLSGDHRGFAQALATAADKLDLEEREPREFPEVTSPQQALATVEGSLVQSQVAFGEALGPLTTGQIETLVEDLYDVMVDNNIFGHTLGSRSSGRRLCDIMEQLDRDALHRAAEALVPLTDSQLLTQLKQIAAENSVDVQGVTGDVVRRINTPGGDIVIGSAEKNVYRLDSMPGVSVVIDLGGNDVYHDGTVSLRRPVLIVIDLEGDDSYRSRKPGVQGSAILGVSMLLDYDGNDSYGALDMAQASALAGAGILIDYAGDDTYQGVRRVQGHALAGVGILLDRAGNDSYRGAMWTQGLGAPLGFGVLDDLEGNDRYYTGGRWYDNYEETPGYEGWGQGIGMGIRQVANGGVGVILDGAGDDLYEYDYLAHGGGYWCGTGFARDFGGNDQRLGATSREFDNSPRTERPYQRFSNGFGCHYALGFLFDDGGDDVYHGTVMGLGFAWDCAVAYLCDFGGHDKYTATKGNTQGQGAQAGLGVIYDYDGNDEYVGYGQGYASKSIWYHQLPQCGGNFSFVVDYGGRDKYGCEASNNSYLQRGDYGGFLIDRPSRAEVAARRENEAKEEAARQAEKEQETRQAEKPTENARS